MEEKNLPDKADEFLAEWLNKDPLLPAAISTIPVFGGPLATFYSEKWHQIHEQKTKALLQQFREHVSSLDQQALRKDFFGTPEEFDLLIQADEQSSKTGSDEKRDLIARLLAGATTNKSAEYSPEKYLHILADLTEKELLLVRSIYEEKWRLSTGITGWTIQVCEELNVDSRDVFLMLARLEARGLLQTVDVYAQDTVATSGGRPKHIGPRDKKGIDRIGRILVSSSFTKLMRFLDLHD